MHNHEWVPIAPEVGELEVNRTVHIWKWCIRCGAIKLGDTIYRPGPHQQKRKLIPENLN